MSASKKIAIIGVSSLILSACGGGGGGGAAPSSSDSKSGPSVQTGYLVDSAVEGVRYQTDSRSGLTGPDGSFQYIEGEQVTFSIGNTSLGSVSGQETVTPFTLAGISPLTQQTEITAAFERETVSSFERALNIAALLQNLDEDGDPDNGINVGNADSVLSGDSVNLYVKSDSFLAQNAVQSAKRKLDRDFDRDLLASVKHLYENLEVAIESENVSRFNATSNADTLQTIDYDYDDNGNVLVERTDTDGDGTADITKNYEYDERGNPISTENSKTGLTETMLYDGNDRLISRLSSINASERLETYEYNSNGKVSRFFLDQDNDGTVDAITRYQYEAGNLVSYTVDKDGDGNPESVAQYVYDSGRVATFSEDQDNDGTPELIIAYAYDEKGNRQSFNISVSPDGFPSAPGKFTYDDADNVVAYELDTDLDGNYDYVETYTYNHRGQRTSYHRDSDGDGNWDSIIQYTYDKNGQRTQMAEDNDGNGIADKVWAGNYQPQILENAWDIILEQG